MDNKNVFIAIALSMSVLLFWAAFFESPTPVNNNTSQQQQKTNENIITPNINESLKVDTISREDSIKSSERIKIENDSIIINRSRTFKKSCPEKQNRHRQSYCYKNIFIIHLIFP